MNRQIVVCVLALLIATSMNASDSVVGKFKQIRGPKFELLNKPLAATADFLSNSYGLFRSTCVNSTLLTKLPESLQTFVQNNFGLMTTIAGGALAGGLALHVHKRRYASNYRNGTEEHREQVMEDAVKELADKLPSISMDGRLAVKPSFWKPQVLDVTLEQKEQCMRLSITNCLQPSLPACSFDLLQGQVSNLQNNLNLQRSIAGVLARVSPSTELVELVPTDNQLRLVPKDITAALQTADISLALHNVTADKLQNDGTDLLQHAFLGLQLAGKKKQVKLSLHDKVSGSKIYFVLRSATSQPDALKRLQENWIACGMPQGIRDVMAAYAAYVPSLGEKKELNVRFSAAEIICPSAEISELTDVQYETMAPEWVLMTDDGTQLVWPRPSNEELNEHALQDVLRRFLLEQQIRNNFDGGKKYVARLNAELAQAVICEIAPPANDMCPHAAGDSAHADRVITINANGMQTKYTLVMQGLTAAQQLADETLRSHIIMAITEAHILCTMSANEFKLRLHEDENEMYYQLWNEEGKLCWQSSPFNIASSSNAGKSSSVDLSPLPLYSDEESAQPCSSTDGVPPLERVSRKDAHAWSNAVPGARRSMSPSVVGYELLGLKRANSMNDMSDIHDANVTGQQMLIEDFDDFESSEGAEEYSEEGEEGSEYFESSEDEEGY